MDPPARVALAAAFFRFFENDSSGETGRHIRSKQESQRLAIGSLSAQTRKQDETSL